MRAKPTLGEMNIDRDIYLMNLITRTLLFWQVLGNLNVELKIFWNTLQRCFLVIHVFFQRQLTQNCLNIEVFFN